MTATHYVDQARHWSRFLEEREAQNAGTLPAARSVLERKLRLPPGALYSLRYRPPKRIAADLYEALRSAVIAACEREQQRLLHEITIAKASGLDVAHPALLKAEAAARSKEWED